MVFLAVVCFLAAAASAQTWSIDHTGAGGFALFNQEYAVWPPTAMAPVGPDGATLRPRSHVPGHLTPRTDVAQPLIIEMARYETKDDYPVNGILLPEGAEASRSNAAVGLSMVSITGGGCVTPAPDGGCAGYKYFEKWTIEWYDPTNTLITSQTLTYQAFTTQATQNCWNGNPCNFAPIDGPNPLDLFTAGMDLSCPKKLGTWTTKVFYQYSTDFTNPTFSARRQIFSQTWQLMPLRDALKVSFDRTTIHPAVEAGTGGVKYPTIPPGTGTIVVSAYECIALGNVNFTLTPTVVPASGGHVHEISGQDTPPLVDVAQFSATSGTTRSDGTAVPITVTTDNVGVDIRIVASTPNIFPGTSAPAIPFTSPEYTLHIGFSNLVPFDADPAYVATTGSHNNTPTDPYACGDPLDPKYQRCNNHRDLNLYANPRYVRFAKTFAAFYYQQFGDKLRLNDMSLPEGGMFDLNGDFTTPEHMLHRLGIEGDVSRHVIGADGTIRFNGLHLKWLQKWIDGNLAGTRVQEGPVHFRISADEIDQTIEEEIQ